MYRKVLLLLALTGLAGCGGKNSPDTPTGQVAAVAAGQEITASEVRAELGQLGEDPQAASKAQPAALQAIVNRKLLAAAATERGLDKTPVGAMQLQKAHDLALVALFQQSVVARVPKPSPDEARIFVQENPASFAQRSLLTVDQLIVPQVTPDLVKAMEPLNSLDEIASLLDKNKVSYRAGAAVVDTAMVEPEVAKRLAQMKVGAVFITPGREGLEVSQIKTARVAPLTGDVALGKAQQMLFAARANGQIKSQIESAIKAGQSTVRINQSYKPAPAAGGTKR